MGEREVGGEGGEAGEEEAGGGRGKKKKKLGGPSCLSIGGSRSLLATHVGHRRLVFDVGGSLCMSSAPRIWWRRGVGVVTWRSFRLALRRFPSAPFVSSNKQPKEA